MRRAAILLTIACVSSALVGVFAFPGSAVVSPKAVVGMWLFDEGKGGTAIDSSMLGNDAAILGPQWVDGYIGKALKFDGSDDYVDCGNHPSFDLTDHLSLVAWVKHAPGNDGYIIIKNSQDDTIRQYGFLDYVSEEGIHFFCNSDVVGRENLWWGLNTGVDDDEWHHVAIAIDSPEVKLFIDGVSKGTQRLGGKIVSVDTSVWIGKRKPSEFAYKGIIDEVAIFNVALTEGDIKSIMDEGLGEANFAISPAGKLAASWARIRTQH